MTDIQWGDIEAAIQAAKQPPPSDPGVTCAEYAEHRGCSVMRARKEIFAAVEAGTMLKGKRWVVDNAGRTVPMNVYRAAP